MTDTVNVMAADLTETAVANGNLKQNLTVKSKGEVAALAETINNMIPRAKASTCLELVSPIYSSRGVGLKAKPIFASSADHLLEATTPASPAKGSDRALPVWVTRSK